MTRRMMWTMMSYVTVMICCVLVHGGRSEELSDIAYAFVDVLSGYYDNQLQVENNTVDFEFIQNWYIPVRLSVFGAKPVILFMETRKGIFVKIELHVVISTEGDDIKIAPYNFTDLSLYKPGEFSLKDLDNLKLDQLRTDPDCIITYKHVGLGIFSADWPDCSFIVNGTHPAYAATFNCDDIYAMAPIGAIEKQGRFIYDIKRRGNKYKLINAPVNYVGPCDKHPPEKDVR